MNLVLTTDYTTTDLVSLADAKQHLRIAATYDDNNVGTLLDAARQLVESETNRAILNQTFTLKLDYFPTEIYLPKGRIQSVTTVKYINTSGVKTTLTDGTDYSTTTGYDDGRIAPINSWPSDISTNKNNVVEVVYVAGFGASKSQLTSWAETAIMLQLSKMYYNMDVSKPLNHIIELNRHNSLAWYKNADRRSI
jgi:uncharacterized phiE125 gp8 family phage protein